MYCSVITFGKKKIPLDGVSVLSRGVRDVTSFTSNLNKKKQKQAVKFVARFQLILRRKFCLLKIIAAIFLFGDFHFQLRMNESVLGGNSLKDNCHRHVDPHDLQIIFFPTRKRNDGNLSRKRRFLIGRRRHKQKYFWILLLGHSSVKFKCAPIS